MTWNKPQVVQKRGEPQAHKVGKGPNQCSEPMAHADTGNKALCREPLAHEVGIHSEPQVRDAGSEMSGEPQARIVHTPS